MEHKRVYPNFKQGLILLALLLMLQLLMGSFYSLLNVINEFLPFSLKNEIVQYFILFYLGPFLTFGYTLKYALNRTNWNLSQTIFGNLIKSGTIYLGTTFLTIGLSIIMSEIDNYIITFLPDELLMEEIFVQLLDNNFLIVLISVGIIAPILEELLFRGVI